MFTEIEPECQTVWISDQTPRFVGSDLDPKCLQIPQRCLELRKEEMFYISSVYLFNKRERIHELPVDRSKSDVQTDEQCSQSHTFNAGHTKTPSALDGMIGV